MKTKKLLSIMLILSVVVGLFSFGGITASASGYIDDIYLKPEQSAIDMANTMSDSYFEVIFHTENGSNSTKMTRLSTGLYKATISQTVNYFEFVLIDINGEWLWHAIALYESDGYNCVSFEGGIDFPVWEQYSSSDSGDGMIYFSPNAEWKNATSRFAVRININGQLIHEELTLVEGNVYRFAEREGATAYIFGALQSNVTSPNQFLYTARSTKKPSAGAMNHYVLTDGETNQAQGNWTIREVAGGEEPITPPSGEIVSGPYDEVFWGYSETEFAGSATLSDALSQVDGSTRYITLFSHINLSDTITISEGSYVLDLAGHRIESNAQIPFLLNNNASLRIKDTGESGSIVALAGMENYIFDIQNATLVIDSGTYETEGSGIICQTGSSSKTVITGGSLYAGNVSVINIHEGKLNVYGGGFYNACSEAHISYNASTYNRNITITNLDTNGNTTLVMPSIQSPVSVTGIGSTDRLIVSDSPNGTTYTQLDPGVICYIETKLILNFSEGHSTVSVRKDQIYTMPQYEGSYPFGKEFEGWRNIFTDEIYHVGMEIIPTKDMTLSPVWIDGVIISVSFNANGGTGSMSEVEATANAPFILPACEFTAPEGKVFDKWQVNGATYENGTSVVLEEDTEILALWKDGIRVVYKANGGVGDDIVTYVDSGTKIILSENTFAAPEGKNFKKWLVRGTEYSPGATVYVTEETEILALWKDGFSVIYKPNGGSGGNREEEYLGETTIILPENFYTAPKNKAFRCWEVNGEEMMPGEPITVSEETTILAVWGDILSVKYLFNVRPLTGVEPYTKTHTDTANEGESYTIKHPTELFVDGLSSQLEAYYWEDEKGRQYQIGETTPLNEDITLTLNYKWRLKVSIDPDNDVDDWQYYDVLEGDEFILPDVPENGNIGYIFDGWKNMKTENMYEAYDETVITQNATFRAQWKRCEEHNFNNGICEHCGSPEKCKITRYSKETKTAYAVAPESGTYTVIFADYEGKKLANIEYTTVTFTEETKGTSLTASITKGFSLSTGDKIMLCSNMTNLVPKCEAYIVE